jgi:hypothetical protein
MRSIVLKIRIIRRIHIPAAVEWHLIVFQQTKNATHGSGVDGTRDM